MVQRNTGRVQKAKHSTIVKSVIGVFYADGGRITLFREDQKENFSDDFLKLKESYEYRIMDDLVENLMNDFDGEHQA